MRNPSVDGRPVVVGLGPRDPSNAAARWAAREAGLRSSPLLVARSHPAGSSDPALEDLLTDVRAAAPDAVEVNAVVSAEPPATLMDRLSREAALLVLGHNRVQWTPSLLLGRVATQLSSTAACPVVTVPADRTEGRSGVAHVLALLDEETDVGGVLQVAAEAARLRGAPLEALSVAELDARSGEGGRTGLPTRSPVELLVVGRPRRGLPLGLGLRSAARGILQTAHCPLVVVTGRPGAPFPRGWPEHGMVPSY